MHTKEKEYDYLGLTSLMDYLLGRDGKEKSFFRPGNILYLHLNGNT